MTTAAYLTDYLAAVDALSPLLRDGPVAYVDGGTAIIAKLLGTSIVIERVPVIAARIHDTVQAPELKTEATASVAETAVEAPKKRGPGRPRKTEAAAPMPTQSDDIGHHDPIDIGGPDPIDVPAPAAEPTEIILDEAPPVSTLKVEIPVKIPTRDEIRALARQVGAKCGIPAAKALLGGPIDMIPEDKLVAVHTALSKKLAA